MKKTLIALFFIIGPLVVLFNLQTEVSVQRSKIIAAGHQEIRRELTDFRRSTRWNPWLSLDPLTKIEFSEKQNCVGAQFSWEGNERVGSGYQEIRKILPSQIHIKVHVTSPWQSTTDILFRTERVHTGTKVTWQMTSKAPYLTTLIKNSDSVQEELMDKGLKDLYFKYQK